MAGEEDTPGKATERTGTAAHRDRPPVTIDLEAETAAKPDVPEGDAPAAPQGAAPRGAGAGWGAAAFLLAGVAGGVIVLALAYGLQMAGVLPSPGQAEATQARAEVADLNDALAALDQRLTNIEAANAQSIADRALLDDLSRQVGVVDAFGTSLSDRLLTAEASIAALEDQTDGDSGDATSQQLADMAERVARLEAPAPATTGDGSSAALEDLRQRIQALESGLAKLETTAPPEPEAAVAATPQQDNEETRAAAIAALKQAAAGSEPFAESLANLDDRDIAPETRAALMPLAETGVPTRAELAAAFPAVASAIVGGEPAGNDGGGFLDRLASYGRSLVTVRPAGSQSGESTTAIVARMRTTVAAGDLAKALAQRETLQRQGQAVSEVWAVAVTKRLEIERLIGGISDMPNAGADSG